MIRHLCHSPLLRIGASVLMALLLGMAGPGASMAQPPASEDPETLLVQGVRMRRAGNDSGALYFFERAYRVAPGPRTAGQLGTCEMAVARFADAEIHLAEALRSTTDKWVNDNRAKLSEAMRVTKDFLGSLEIVGRPQGAEVEVDGRTVGRLPLPKPLRVTSGKEVILRVSAPGYEQFRRSVMIGQRELTRVVIELEGVPANDSTTSRSAARSGGPAGGPGGMSAPPDRDQAPGIDPSMLTPRSDSSGSWRRPAGWAAAGVAAALAGGGIVFLTTSNSRIDKFNNYMMPNASTPSCNRQAPEDGGSQCGRLLDQAELARTISIISFAGAGVATAAAVILFATAPPAEPSYALHCTPALGAGATLGATCGARF